MHICIISQVLLPDHEQPRQHFLASVPNLWCSLHNSVCADFDLFLISEYDRIGLRDRLFDATSNFRDATWSDKLRIKSWIGVSNAEIFGEGRWEIMLSAIIASSSREDFSEPASIALTVSGKTAKKIV